MYKRQTRYYYDGALIIAEGIVDSSGEVTLKAQYTRGIGLVSHQDQGGNKAFYLHNGHGDVVDLRSSSGALLNKYSYDIWGNPLTTIENIENPFRYSGEMWDSTVNLQYLRARWYDPSIGRFISEDTYEGETTNSLSLNLYTYVENNPLKYIDPSGHMPTESDVNYKIEQRDEPRLLAYIGVHHVAANLFHTSIIIFVDKNSKFWNHDAFKDNYDEFFDRRYVTIGAGPGEDGGLSFLRLMSGLNRKHDRILDNKVEFLKLEITEDLIEKLLELNANYQKKVVLYNYLPVPGNFVYNNNTFQYNSNSFVHGLLRAAGYENIPTPSFTVPGWNKPVPKRYFR